jgi:hypothetical protein
LIVLVVFAALIALAVIAIQSAARDEGDAPLTSHAVLEVPAATGESSNILSP